MKYVLRNETLFLPYALHLKQKLGYKILDIRFISVSNLSKRRRKDFTKIVTPINESEHVLTSDLTLKNGSMLQ